MRDKDKPSNEFVKEFQDESWKESNCLFADIQILSQHVALFNMEIGGKQPY